MRVLACGLRGGDLSIDLVDDGNGWEWRVDMRKQEEGPYSAFIETVGIEALCGLACFGSMMASDLPIRGRVVLCEPLR